MSDCGCCTTPAAAIPAAIENRPWLSAVAYRIGTFATFRKAILDELSRTPELAGLSARLSDDYTITTIELWSAVADVLTFYQERIANEAFLRTATLRDSVLRLVRLIGYELRPGAAATTGLAFTLDAGAVALIPTGTRVQSIPGEGEKAQKFETLADLPADARLNKLRLFPAPTATSPTGKGSTGAIVAPDTPALAAATTLAPGDRVLLYAPEATEVLTVREVRARDDLLTVSWALPIGGTAFTAAFDAGDPARRAYKLGRSFHLFGFDAPATVVVAEPIGSKTPALAIAVTDFKLDTTGAPIALDGRYPGLKAGAVVLAVATPQAGPKAIPFVVNDVGERLAQRTATTTTTLATVVTTQSGTVTQLTLAPLGAQTLANLPSDDIRNIVLYELVGEPLRFWPYIYADVVSASVVVLPGRRAGWSSIEVGRTIEKGIAKPGIVLDVSDLPGGRSVLLTDAKGGTPVAATVAGAALVGSGVSFAPTDGDAATIRQLGLASDQATPITVLVSSALGAPVAFPNTRRELTVTLGALPPQTLSLDATAIGGIAGGAISNVAAALQAAIRKALPGVPTFARALAWEIDGAIAVAPGVAGDRVAFAPSANDPATVVALGLDPPRARFLDGVLTAPIPPLAGTVANGSVRVTVGADAPVDRSLFTILTDAATLASAFATLAGVAVNAKATADERVLLLPPLPQHEPRAFLRLALDLDAPLALDATTAVLLGNVAPASHGETVRNEIVGDGDASRPFQRFALKKKPVTFLAAAAPGGVASSLRLLVNGVRWTEVPSLYGAQPRDEVYVTRLADDGTLSVQFGDGVTGARPPSGRQNLVASYRQGIGVAGRVAAGRLATLLDRPTGVKNVTQLAAADGGADPETLARSRQVGPSTVRTFGRAVSLLDFEDTALFAGEVAKAKATWAWTGDSRVLHLTVAAQGGALFSPEGLRRIAATLATERDPNHQLRIDNYTPVAVQVDASLRVDSRYVTADVLAEARAALLTALSFDVRRFAQPVYLSDVFAVLQNVPGVVAVDVDTLDLKNRDAAFRAAHGVDDTLPPPQARLLMLPARPAGAAGVVLPAELAAVEVPTQDIRLRASGGLTR